MTDDAPAAPGFSNPERKHGLIGPFSGRQLAVALAVVFAAAVILFAVTRPIASVTPSGAAAAAATQFAVGPAIDGLRIGDRAPELRVQRQDGTTFQLHDLQGNSVSLAALRGRPVWLSFWASWCPPCQAETPVVRDLYNSYKDRGLAVVAISVQEASAADVTTYAQRYGLTYTIGADLSGDIFRLYRVYGLPTQFFLDSNGVIRSIVQGPVDYNLGLANIQDILPAATPSTPVTSPAASAK